MKAARKIVIIAKKSVMIYDTCESGSLTGTRSVDAAMAQSAAVERRTRAMGRTILSASTDDAPALEGYQGHVALMSFDHWLSVRCDSARTRNPKRSARLRA